MVIRIVTIRTGEQSPLLLRLLRLLLRFLIHTHH
jgi:hypothetical protein